METLLNKSRNLIGSDMQVDRSPDGDVAKEMEMPLESAVIIHPSLSVQDYNFLSSLSPPSSLPALTRALGHPHVGLRVQM